MPGKVIQHPPRVSNGRFFGRLAFNVRTPTDNGAVSAILQTFKHPLGSVAAMTRQFRWRLPKMCLIQSSKESRHLLLSRRRRVVELRNFAGLI